MRITALAALFALPTLASSPLQAQSSLEWHGYGQLRYTRSTSAAGFSLRRGKFWMQGPVPGVERLSFKVQGLFRNGAAGAFVLQDLFAEYAGGLGRIRLGQMVPSFSLQRSQPDFLVPLVERAGVVDALIPGARTLARDIGVQLFLGDGEYPLHLALGLFNGFGANHTVGREGDFLLTARLTYTQPLSADVKATVGASAAYRETSETDVGLLSPAGKGFAGRDVRWGVEAQLAGEGWEVQGEWLESHLEGDVSHGFYVLGSYALSADDQIVLSAEQLDAAAGNVGDEPWFIAGFNHFFHAPAGQGVGHAHIPDGAGSRFPTRLMLDFRTQFDDAGTRYGATVQLQFFLH